MPGILIFLDDAPFASDLSDSLTNLGHDVLGCFPSAEGALQRVRSLKPDLILTDIELQGAVDGVEAVERIRGDFNIPVLYLTLPAEGNLLDRVVKTEPYGFVGRSARSYELKALIDTALHKHASDKRARDSAGRFRATFKKAAVSMVLIDPTTRAFVDFNEMAHADLGYSEQELGGLRLDDLEASESSDAITKHIPVIMGGNVHAFDTKLRHGNGKIRDYAVKIRPISLDGSRLLLGLWTDITDRKAAEKQIAQQTAHMRLAQEMARIGYWTFDIASRMPNWSNMMFTVLGCDPAKGVPDYEAHRNFIHPGDWETFDRAVQGATQGTPYLIELRVVFPDGCTHYVMAQGHPQINEDGEIASLFGCTQDITERKLAEKASKASEERFRFAMDAAHDGLWDWDMTGDYVYRSPGFFFMLGYEEEEFPQGFKGWESVVHPEDLGPTIKALGDYIDGKRESYEVEFRMFHKSGQLLWILSRGKIVAWDDCGTPIRMVGTHSNITARKEAEEALKQREAMYRLLFDNSPVGIILVDTKGEIIEINQPLLDALGSPSKEATQKINMFELPQLIESGISDAFRSCMNTGGRLRKEFPYVSKWGKQSHLRFFLTPVTDGENTITGCQAIVEDITLQRKLEELLRQTQKMEAVGTLAGGIAHDFNNLLHIISGQAEFLEMELKSKNMKLAEIDAIRHAADRGADLVRRLLTFSTKTDTGFAIIDLNDPIRSGGSLLSRTIPKMIAIKMDLAKDLSPVRANASQIEQILLNLASNATDAMPDGGTLTIETRNIDIEGGADGETEEIKSGRYALLTVSDTGQGMAPDVREHIFEPFFTTRGLAERTGLGLSTVFGSVKSHGGRIICESEVGKGTVFSIYLPASHEPKPFKEVKATKSDALGGDETILVVDDEPLIADLAKRILQKAGYSIITASNGAEALQIYSQRTSEISAVVLDLVMPEMGGKQCLEKLLTIDPSVKAVIASGFHVQDDTKAFLKRAAKCIVSKPFNLRQLVHAVREAIDAD